MLRRALAAAALLATGPAQAQEAADTVVKSGAISEDLYLAGGRVEVSADVTGDVVAAGRSVAVTGRVTGDALLAGAEVEITGAVLDDVRAAGGTVRMAGSVGDDALLAGGRVSIDRGARVGGRAFLAGGEVRVAGSVAKALRAVGGTVVLTGEVLGDAEIAAGQVEVGPAAHIAGRLRYTSSAPARIAAGARIEGPVIRIEPPARQARLGGAAVVLGILFLAGLALAGAVALRLFPRFSLAAARSLAVEPWACVGVGLALVLATPLVLVLLLPTVVGAPLALAGAALWLVLLLAGYLASAFVLGDLALRRLRPEPTRGATIVAFVVALAVLRLLRLVPVLGAVVSLLAVAAGAGAVAREAGRAWRASRASAPAAPPAT